jgi:hypothetical protein
MPQHPLHLLLKPQQRLRLLQRPQQLLLLLLLQQSLLLPQQLLPAVLRQVPDAESLKEKKLPRCAKRGTSSSSFVKSTRQDAPTSAIPILNGDEVEEPSSSGPR